MIAGVSNSFRTSTRRSLPSAVAGTGQSEQQRRKPVAEQKLKGKKVAILAADMVERVELIEPRKALEDAGAETTLISLKPGEIKTFNHFDPAETEKVDKTAEEVDASDYDALLIPGGVGNPDQLRGDENVVSFVRDFFEQGKPVAAICHGPWVLVEAGVVRGRTVTSWPTLQTDIRNAGGNWVDEEVVVDSGLVTSRNPDDIPAFNAKIVEEFCEGRHSEQREKTTSG
jgi:protease I